MGCVPPRCHTTSGARIAALGTSVSELVRRRFGGQRSPDLLDLVSDVTVPALLMHGERDQTVPATESRVLASALRGGGVCVDLVMDPDSDHDLLCGSTQRRVAPTAGRRVCRGPAENAIGRAEVGAVYDLTPAPRSAADIMGGRDADAPGAPAPAAKNTWLTASVVDDAAQVLAAVFDEAERRDPTHRRRWVALGESLG